MIEETSTTNMNESSTIKQVFHRLSWVDKLLPLWIICAITFGIIISVYVPSSHEAFQGAVVINVSIPLAIGMIVMMIPPLCKVEWEHSKSLLLRKDRVEKIVVSLILNWVICPVIMLGLAWLTLFDLDEYRVGVILIGIARCIAMVLIWNEIALGDRELCSILVIINSILQLILFAPYKILFCDILGGSDGSNNYTSASNAYTTVAQTIAFFLGIPLVLGFLIRFVGVQTLGKKVYNEKLIPIISPFGLLGLLYTIIALFIDKGDEFVGEIGLAFRCFVPLILYFVLVWFATFLGLRWMYGRRFIQLGDESSDSYYRECGCEKNRAKFEEESSTQRRFNGLEKYCSAPYGEIITQTFTAASNNFELSLAVAIAIYGNGSREAIAATFGPLVEIPVLIILAFLARYFEAKFLWLDQPEALEPEDILVDETAPVG